MGWTLGIAFAAVAAVLAWRLKSGRAERTQSVEAPLSDSYVLRGDIHVTSTCESPAGGFPRSVLITAALTDGRQARSEASLVVQLDALPASDDEERFEGSYELTVPWDGARPARFWEPPRATRPDGEDLCADLGCDGPNRPVNIASRPRRIDVVAVETVFTLRIACICVPD